MIPTLPEFYKIVDATAGPVTTNGGVTGQYVSAKTGQTLFLVLSFTQAVGHATVTTFKEAKDVSGTSVQTVANNVKLWTNAATATNDTLVRVAADATSVTLTSGIAKMMVVAQFDLALISDAFTTFGFSIATSAQASNFVSGVWYLQSRFPQATPPSAVTN